MFNAAEEKCLLNMSDITQYFIKLCYITQFNKYWVLIIYYNLIKINLLYILALIMLLIVYVLLINCIAEVNNESAISTLSS